MLGITTPMVLVRLLLRPRAIAFGLYLSCRAAVLTTSFVASLISGLSAKALETVEIERLRCSAIAFKVVLCAIFRFCYNVRPVSYVKFRQPSLQ